jgi:branched-chain amino acid transport system substrate-binding protein
MRLLRLAKSLTLLVCITFLLFACNRSDQIANQLKIGVVGPFEGPNAHIGKIIMNSVKLYFDRNRAEGLSVNLIPIDDKSNPADAVAALQATVSDPKLVALIAFYNSSTALAGKPIIQEAKLPTLIYSASNPAVTDNALYYFRLVPTDDGQAVVLADYAKDIGGNNVAILYYADEYGKGLSDGIQSRARERGLNVVSVQSYDATTTDFRPMLTIVKGKSPDVVFICGFVEKSIAILNQAAEKGLKAKFLAGDGTFNEEQLVQGAGVNAEGVYVAAPYVFDETNQKNKDFLDAYWKAYDTGGTHQKPASWSAFAYDAAGILDTALRAGHRDRASIYEFVRGMNSEQKGYDGITGITYFNQKGDAAGRRFRLAVVKDKQFAAPSTQKAVSAGAN